MPLPELVKSRRLAALKFNIINVSSASAFLPIPYWSNYSSSKTQLLLFSEGLWFELKGYGVDVLALCPGSTQTEFAEVAGTDMQGGKAEHVVTTAFRALGRKVVVVPGMGNITATLLSRFFTRRGAVLLGSLVIGKQRQKST